MKNYRNIGSSLEVWRAIRKHHKSELCVYSSYSAPDGDEFGDPNQGVMMTEYGFKDGDYPLMGARTTWDIHPENKSHRNNELHEYWLCSPINADN